MSAGVARARGRMMAWRVHAYEPSAGAGAGVAALRLEEARVPAVRAPDELVVRVRAASLNPLDVAMLSGYGSVALAAQRRLLTGDNAGAGADLPLVCGRDFCGVVETRGAGVRPALRRGVRVWGVLPPHVTSGAHAQYVLVKDRWVTAAPSALDDLSCAGAPYAALTACALLRSAALGAGAPRVLLLGLGGVGQAALQLLAERGAHVTVGATAELHALATELGARDALDRHAPEYEERLERAGPYEAVLDCAGLGGERVPRCRFSRYVTLTTPLLRETDARGLAAGSAAAAAQLARQCAATATATTGGAGAGAGWGCLPPHVRWAFFSARGADLEALRVLAERGRFRVAVSRAWGWRAGAHAYSEAARGNARGKLLIDFTDDSPPPTPSTTTTTTTTNTE